MKNENDTSDDKQAEGQPAERAGWWRRLFGPSMESLQFEIIDLRYRNELERDLRKAAEMREERLRKEAEQVTQRHCETLKRVQTEWDKKDAEILAAKAKRNVSWPKPARRLTMQQVAAAFNVPLDSGLMAALHQELNDQIEELADRVSQAPSATLTEQTRLHLAGGLEHLRILQKELLDITARGEIAEDENETKT